MTILVTNDDGNTIGLRILLEAAKQSGDAYALYPHKQQSAVSKSLTLHKVLRLHAIEDGMHELSGTPADCVLFSIYSKEFKKPDLVLSGINFGDNTSLDAILSSGTIGACWEAVTQGIPAIAFSMLRLSKDWHNLKNWGEIELLKQKTIEIIKALKPRLRPDCFYSVNFPNDFAGSKIVFIDKLQRTRFHVNIEKRLDPSNHPYYWLAGDFSKCDQNTDTYEVLTNKNIAITEISLKSFDMNNRKSD